MDVLQKKTDKCFFFLLFWRGSRVHVWSLLGGRGFRRMSTGCRHRRIGSGKETRRSYADSGERRQTGYGKCVCRKEGCGANMALNIFLKQCISQRRNRRLQCLNMLFYLSLCFCLHIYIHIYTHLHIRPSCKQQALTKLLTVHRQPITPPQLPHHPSLSPSSSSSFFCRHIFLKAGQVRWAGFVLM